MLSLSGDRWVTLTASPSPLRSRRLTLLRNPQKHVSVLAHRTSLIGAALAPVLCTHFRPYKYTSHMINRDSFLWRLVPHQPTMDELYVCTIQVPASSIVAVACAPTDFGFIRMGMPRTRTIGSI